MKVKIYTDGACSGNPGKGGYGVVLRYGNHEKRLSAGFRKTTNNRMELMAVIAGLEALQKDGLEVEVISDSRYVVDAVEKKWVMGWEKNGFKKKKNPDLWERFLRVYRRHHVQFHWIRGHAGHAFNELCDEMAVAASHQHGLPADEGYEAVGEQDD